MTLSLNHQQRLNLMAILGSQRGNVGEQRAIWKMMDRLELDEQEQKAINYRLEMKQTNNGLVEVPAWDGSKTLNPRQFEFSEGETARVSRAIDEWPHFITSIDRIWLEPVLAQLPEQSSNGNKA